MSSSNNTDTGRKLQLWCFEMDALPGVEITTELDQHIINTFFKICTKFSFQVERARGNGWYHYQCAIDMKNRYTAPICLSTLESYLGKGCIKNLRPMTVTATKGKQAFEYCEKTDTSVRGPWSEGTCIDHANCPRELKEHKFNFAWTKQLIELAKMYNFRDYFCIIDHLGGLDKSTVAKYLEFNKLAFRCNYMPNAKDMIQYVMSCEGGRSAKCIIVDIPRSVGLLNPKKQLEFWSAMEQLKNGDLYDLRYSGKKFMMAQHPTIIIFMNFIPPPEFITGDRLQLLMINHDLTKLVKYNPSLIDSYMERQKIVRDSFPVQHAKQIFDEALPVPPEQNDIKTIHMSEMKSFQNTNTDSSIRFADPLSNAYLEPLPNYSNSMIPLSQPRFTPRQPAIFR